MNVSDEIQDQEDRFCVPSTISAYNRGYQDGQTAGQATAVIEAMKSQITLLRIELKDALTMAYGARMNWPESAKALLESE